MRFLLSLFVVLLSGCATVQTDSTDFVKSQQDKRQKPLVILNSVDVGMTYQEVSEVLGKQLQIGYQLNEQVLEAYEKITLKNPYRVEMIDYNGKVFMVAYYYTKIVNSDDIVADDELEPLVFEDERLVGKGRDYLFNLKQEVEKAK